MYEGLTVAAVIPARDEAENIGEVVGGLAALRTVDGKHVLDDIVVCDNGSTDATAERARAAGARVTVERTPGYGRACLSAIAALRPVDVVLFVDGDQSCELRQALDLLRAMADGADLAIGSRVLGRMEPGALSPPQIAGNRVASLLIRLLWGHRVTDLGPFRAIRADALRRLDMRDTAYGWTVEMQIKAIQMQMRIVETPVGSRRRRFGRSKVGGTVRGVVGASIGILGMIVRLRSRRVTSGPASGC
ncbi:MAG: glycosyltransferase family 2 protein [Acidobacteria bacterium]|nr:glycosyltransferase family 2 protein [Acidobacteriota bacterium]MYK88865.1 glycosyltransferase family 2 protein [Acidobacteriota bacterium]